MKKTYFSLICFFVATVTFAQQKRDSITSVLSDSLSVYQIEEVIVIGNPTSTISKENKALGSLDSYLENSQSVNMIKRGAYAWEPMLNGMSTDRSILTIDGMRIFQACTDKMDPITSYVENTNLSRAKIDEGQSGSEYGGTIAGSIDLIRRKSGFKTNKKTGGSVFAGFESNNKQQIYGAAINHSASRFFADIDFTYRDAENYHAGHRSGQNSEVLYSQFTKYNISAISGFKITDNQELEGGLIFDKATDVGYPGLPMDVSLAKATIASLLHRYRNFSESIHLWETKLYFNSITHIMDDSHRPVVPIRMDMPGWSETQGFYSKILGSFKTHSFKTTLSAYRNNSLAEMTMYPNNPNEKEMFMLTWPDVDTYYGGLHIEDDFFVNEHLNVMIQGGIGIHHNSIKSEMGLNSLRLFYPELKADKTRVLKNISSRLTYHHSNFLHHFGIGYGDRAPTVSEGYGFYLLNVNDNYDYVGNPYLKNEKSLNAEISSSFTTEKFSAKAKMNYFYMMDYIIGKPKPGIPAMNVTADGIKVYEQLAHASLLNSSLGMDYAPFDFWTFSAAVSYRYGQGAKNTVLPLIQPLNYSFKIRYEKTGFFAEASLEGSSKNRNSIEFGEIQKPGYAIANFAVSKNFEINKQNLNVKAGVENLWNQYYSTFDNWFGIPNMGRNIYLNLIYRM